jgi:hypothetical protein
VRQQQDGFTHTSEQMPDRDWEKEMAKIDRQLASIPDEALAPQAPARGQSTAPLARPAASAAPGAAARPADRVGRFHTLGLVARLALVVALGVGVAFWPYVAQCGLGLAGYLGAVTMVAVGGVWTAVVSWRRRAAWAHVVSLLLIMWGASLAALEVLPRVGYARASLDHPAVWLCR